MIAISDNCGYILSPLTIAPVNKSEIVLLSDGLKDLKSVATDAGIEIKGARIISTPASRAKPIAKSSSTPE